jgi:hypothetical protein
VPPERASSPAEDEVAEEVCHRGLAVLLREEKSLAAALEQARARVSAEPVAQQRQLRTLLDLLDQTPPEERPRVRSQVKALIASLVAKVVVYIQRKGKYGRRCWAWVIYHDGRWRRVFIDQDGSSITVAAGEDEPLEFHVVEGEGWQ